jgi:hypothetical protein
VAVSFQDHTRPNASCDTLEDVEVARAAGWSTVIVDADGSLPGTTVGDSRRVSCPFETQGRQCIDCRLCSRTTRPSTVVFQAHGTRRRAARAAIGQLRKRDGATALVPSGQAIGRRGEFPSTWYVR